MTDGKGNLLIRAAGAFGLPEESMPGVSRLTVIGKGRVHIENQKGLLQYGREEITVNAGRMIVKLTGTGLELSAMTDLEMEVTGDIARIEFIE